MSSKKTNRVKTKFKEEAFIDLFSLGKPLAKLLLPTEDDCTLNFIMQQSTHIRLSLDFVLKPKHSAFYCTPLDILLNHLGTETSILAGIAGNICVLFTANDAYMRNYKIVVLKDCIGSNTKEVL